MTTDPPVYVGIDQGSHATRAVAFDAGGSPLASAYVSVDTDRSADGRVEHDGERLVAGLRSVLDDLALRVPATRWHAAGLAVQRSTVACWDRDSGALLSPVISWQDRRQAGWLEGLAAHAARIHDLTGLPLSPHYGASKLRWCLEHLPDVAAARDAGQLCCGPLASLLLARLVEGRPCLCDESSASRTQLWSPHERRWSPELLGLFGVPPQVLPRLSPTGAEFGPVRVGEARVPLRACTGDQAAVPFAAGPLEPGSAWVNLGTGAFLLLPVARALRAAPLLTSVLFSSPASVAYALEGTVNGAGSALEWFAREEGLPVERMLPALDRDPLPGDDAPLFLNGVSGIGSPFWVPFFRSRYVGAGDEAARLRAVIESIAFLLRANLDEMSRHVGLPSRLVVSGGLARSDFLMRLLASLTGVPVLRLAETEATARGAAFLAAGQPRDWQRPPLQAFAPAGEPVLQSRYLRWRELLDAALAA
jgi:glycerol kinase